MSGQRVWFPPGLIQLSARKDLHAADLPVPGSLLSRLVVCAELTQHAWRTSNVLALLYSRWFHNKTPAGCHFQRLHIYIFLSRSPPRPLRRADPRELFKATSWRPKNSRRNGGAPNFSLTRRAYSSKKWAETTAGKTSGTSTIQREQKRCIGQVGATVVAAAHQRTVETTRSRTLNPAAEVAEGEVPESYEDGVKSMPPVKMQLKCLQNRRRRTAARPPRR